MKEPSFKRIKIRKITSSDETSFIEMTNKSLSFHKQWIKPPRTKIDFIHFFNKSLGDNFQSYVILNLEKKIIGIINLSEIVRGNFHSAYLSYYVHSDYKHQGYLTEAFEIFLPHVFYQVKLHRLEANIQPENIASIKMISKCGFIKEGFSKNYLKLNDKWTDHERWAITKEHYEEINN